MKKKILTSALIFLISSFLYSQNNSLNFDGTDDYVDLGSSVCNGMRTIELWFNSSVIIDNTLTDFISLAVRNDLGENDEMHLTFDVVDPNKGKIRFGRSAGAGSIFVISNSDTWNANQWYHVAGVFHPTNGLELYIDGVKQTDTDPHTGSPGTRPEITALGVWGDFGDRFFNGKIDDVRFWNTARTQTEIQNNRNTELTGNESGLISYYKMDIPNSTCDVEDCNSNENHGTRIGTGGSNNLPQFSTDVPSLTDVACGVSVGCLLPVELINFSGKNQYNLVKLTWETASEINNLGFEIQKSKNGRNWQILDFVRGNGTSNLLNEYEYQDSNPFSGINYYRLKQIDFDGVFEFSKVISVSVRKENEIKIYPNPTNGRLEIVGVEMAEIKIIDSFGRVVKELAMANGNIDISEFSKGLYFISVKTEKGVITKRIIKE